MRLLEVTGWADMCSGVDILSLCADDCALPGSLHRGDLATAGRTATWCPPRRALSSAPHVGH